MEKRDFGVAILILVLLVILGAVGETNYQRNKAAEERAAARVYEGYSDAEITTLIRSYEKEVTALEARYGASKSGNFETRSGGLIDEQIKEFERAQKKSAATRSMVADVAQQEAVLRELRREQSLRGSGVDSLGIHLRRLLTI
jgi:predicted negative regulator of RcsB-dependent stress response